LILICFLSWLQELHLHL